MCLCGLNYRGCGEGRRTCANAAPKTNSGSWFSPRLRRYTRHGRRAPGAASKQAARQVCATSGVGVSAPCRRQPLTGWLARVNQLSTRPASRSLARCIARRQAARNCSATAANMHAGTGCASGGRGSGAVRHPRKRARRRTLSRSMSAMVGWGCTVAGSACVRVRRGRA